MAQDKVTLQLTVDDRMTASVNRAAGAINNLHGPTSQAASGFSKMQASIVTMNQALELIGRAARVVSKAFLAIVETADAFRRTEILLTNLTGSIIEARASMEFLVDLAQKTPNTLLTLQDAFVRLTATGIENTERAMKALTDAVAAFGGTDEDLKLVSLAISQMAGKGVISMEELRRQLGERIPTAIQIMARELDLTTAELFDRVEKGALDATTGINALITGFEKDFSGSALKMMDTWQGATSNMADAWDQFLRAVGETGILDLAIDAVQGITFVIFKMVDAMNMFDRVIVRTHRDLTVLANIAAFGAFSEEVKALNIELERLRTPLAHIDDAMFKLELKIKKAAEATEKRLNKELVKANKEAEKLALVFDDINLTIQEMEQEATQKFISDLEKANKEADRLFEEFARIDDELGEIGKRTEKFFENLARRFANQVAGVGSAISAFQQTGSPAAAGAAFFADLLLSNERLQELLAPINESLIALVTPIAEALAPSLEALVPIIQDLAPAFKMIGIALRTYLAPTAAGLRALHVAIGQLNAGLLKNGISMDRMGEEIHRWGKDMERFVKDLNKLEDTVKKLIEFFRDLIDAIVELPERIFEAVKRAIEQGFGGGDAGRGPVTGIPGSPIHAGGALTNENMLRMPGLAPNEGLFLGKIGETVVPTGIDGQGRGGGLTFIMQGNDPDEIVKIVQEQQLLGRFA